MKKAALLVWIMFCALAAVKDGITWMRTTEPRFALFAFPRSDDYVQNLRLKSFKSFNELEQEAYVLMALNAMQLDIPGDPVFFDLPWSPEAEAHYSLEWVNKSTPFGFLMFDTNYVLNLFEEDTSLPTLLAWVMLAPVKVMLWPIQDVIFTSEGKDRLAFAACCYKHIIPGLIHLLRENKTEL